MESLRTGGLGAALGITIGILVALLAASSTGSLAPIWSITIATILGLATALTTPQTPLVLISPIYCGIQERTPGPIAIDPAALRLGAVHYVAPEPPQDTSAGRVTLTAIRQALAEVASARTDDPQLHYVSGLDLFGPTDADRLPLPDFLHPSAEAHELIGQRFAALMPVPHPR